MSEQAKFLLSREKLIEQYEKLREHGLKVSYSYKTNSEVGKIIQNAPELSDVEFSIHSNEEFDELFSNFESNEIKKKIWFFTQAESVSELQELIKKGIRKFVVDNPVDLERVLEAVEKDKIKVTLSLRMKFQEHRIGSGKYFVYGMTSDKVNDLISKETLSKNKLISDLGIHIHRKTQNTSEWEILEELKDSLEEETINNISFLNLGGGLPVRYRSYSSKVFDYIFSKIKEAKDWLEEREIKTYIEPGRFLAAPPVKLETEIIQVYDRNIVINTTVYNCAIDNVLTNTKMLLEEEIGENSENKEEVEEYLIKGNSPTRDDIFRYKVKLPKSLAKVGKKLTFVNAGAYNYTTDFFGYKKLPTIITD